jgi:hypothetical protein
MNRETALERRFWAFWLVGLLLLAVQIVMNVWLMTNISPLGISDHQAAGTAARVDAIQAGWVTASVMDVAVISMCVDLIFIGVYAWGAWAGGKMFAKSPRAMLARLGTIITLAAAGFGLADYIETVCQIVQAAVTGGDDGLAGIAAQVRPVKTVFFLVTFFGILVALAIRRMTRGTA